MWDMERRPITVAEVIENNIVAHGGCWFWLGPMPRGKPGFTSRDYDGRKRMNRVIPLLWCEENHMPVPDGHVLTCTHRVGGLVCVNPRHYKPTRSGFARQGERT